MGYVPGTWVCDSTGATTFNRTEINDNILSFFIIASNYGDKINPSSVGIVVIPIDKDIYCRTNIINYNNGVPTGRVESGGTWCNNPNSEFGGRYVNRLFSIGSGYWRDSLPDMLTEPTNVSRYTCLCPIFETIEDSFDYIDSGDLSKAVNHEEFEEKVQCDWYVGYTDADNTTYSLAFDNEQFYNPNSIYFGKDTTFNAEIEIDYYIGEILTNIYSITMPYGSTWVDTLSNIIGQSNYNIAQNIAIKIANFADIDDIVLKFTLTDGTVSSSQGYVRFNHNEVIDYGFYETPHGDTINFKSGEVLNNDNSDISNPDHGIETSDTMTDESVPSVSGGGLLTSSYALTPTRAQGIGDFLWGADFLTNIKLINNNPIENIVSCKLFPLNFTNGTEQSVKIGNVTASTQGIKLSNTLYKYDSSVYKIPKFYDDNLDFMNYAPYTKIELYLPFIGLKEIPTDLCMDKNIQIKWIIDVVTGTLQTNLHINGKLTFIFNSNIGADIPLTAQNLSQVESAYIQNAIGGGISLAQGNIAGVANAVIGSATTQYHSQTHGTPSPNTSVVSLLYPYVIITRVKTKDIGNVTKDGTTNERAIYKKMVGCPSFKVKNLGNVKGYTEIYNPQIQIDGAMKKEIDEINRLLKSGVILKD